MVFLFLIQSVSTGLNAQDKPGTSQGDLTFYLDHSCFAGNEEKTFVEFYLMFFADQLTSTSDSIKRLSEIKIKVVIKGERGNVIEDNDWITEVNYDPNQALDKVFYDKWDVELIPGDYEIIVEARDLNSDSNGKLRKKVTVPAISNKNWCVSQLQFITAAENDTNENQFKKGNFKIIPNPSRRYGIFIPKLYYYYEIYGIDSIDSSFIVNYEIIDINNNVRKKLENIEINKHGISVSIIHGIDVSNLNSGIYTLVGRISNSENRKTLSFTRQFEIIQADFFENKPAINEEQASVFRTILSYLGTANQVNFYQSLNISGKAEYIIQYWKNLDPDPSTITNEYLLEIQKRFNHAKNKFGGNGVNGWETDRGRICIKYGIPHQINQFNNEANTAPYEIWIYNENRTYEFIFGDIRSNGRYVLLHSNKEGEIYNEYWRDQIQRM